MTDYVLASSLLKSRERQGTKRDTQVNNQKAFDESQIPVITTRTTAVRQFDRASGQVPASTLKQYYGELLASDRRLDRGNMLVEKFINDLFDIDRRSINAVMKNMAPIIKSELVPYSNRDVTAHDNLASTGERGRHPTTSPPSTYDDVTLAGGPLYLAKVRDAKKAKEEVAQVHESTDGTLEANRSSERRSESIAVSKGDDSVASEIASQSSANPECKDIVEETDLVMPQKVSDAIDGEMPRSKVPISPTEQSATSESEALDMACDQEAQRFEENPVTTSGYARRRNGEEFMNQLKFEPLAEHTAGQPEKSQESVISNQDLQEKLDFVVSDQRSLENKLDSLRSDHDYEIKCLDNDIAILKNNPNYGPEIEGLKESVSKMQQQLAKLNMDSRSLSDSPKLTSASDQDDFYQLGNRRNRTVIDENTSEVQGKPVVTDTSVDSLIITPAMDEIRKRTAAGSAKQLSQDPDYFTKALVKSSRRDIRRVTELAKQGWVIVRVELDGSLVLQKRPKNKQTGVRRRAKFLGGVIVISSLILTIFFGYGYTMMI
ncbi:hypothetical protein V1509DRAFT_633227 [Lipomyces kononenkoae]